MGGLVQQTTIVAMSETDSATDIASEVSASAEKLSVEAKATVAGGQSHSAHIKGREAHSKVKVLGGDPMIWLGLNEDNRDDVQEQWVQTIKEGNRYVVDVALKPMWELLLNLNETKAHALKDHMICAWMADEARLRRDGHFLQEGEMCMIQEGKEMFHTLYVHAEAARQLKKKGNIAGIRKFTNAAMEDLVKDWQATWHEIWGIWAQNGLCAHASRTRPENRNTCHGWDNGYFAEEWVDLKERCALEPKCKGFQYWSGTTHVPNTPPGPGGFLLTTENGALSGTTQHPILLVTTVNGAQGKKLAFTKSKKVYECWSKTVKEVKSSSKEDKSSSQDPCVFSLALFASLCMVMHAHS